IDYYRGHFFSQKHPITDTEIYLNLMGKKKGTKSGLVPNLVPCCCKSLIIKVARGERGTVIQNMRELLKYAL
ncbi:MAG: hypothetical protein RR397_07295, partial [Odoribacter sp.]